MTPPLSIIVAAFNEEATITDCVRSVYDSLPGDTEVLVVDGGHDRTPEKIAAIAPEFPLLRYIKNENDRGKGHAIRRGIAEARAPIHAQFDADLQFFASDLPAVIAPVAAGKADISLGSRFLPASGRDQQAAFTRSFGNWLVSAYASLLFRHRMTDVMAGVKAWTAEAAHRIAIRSDKYSYEVEIPTRALRHGLRVCDVTISTQARQGGESKVPVFRTGMRLLWDITRFRFGGK